MYYCDCGRGYDHHSTRNACRNSHVRPQSTAAATTSNIISPRQIMELRAHVCLLQEAISKATTQLAAGEIIKHVFQNTIQQATNEFLLNVQNLNL